jgi:hypothetical protein
LSVTNAGYAQNSHAYPAKEKTSDQAAKEDYGRQFYALPNGKGTRVVLTSGATKNPGAVSYTIIFPAKMTIGRNTYLSIGKIA